MGSFSHTDNEGRAFFGGQIKKERKATIVIGLPAAGKSTKVANPLSKKMGAFILDSDEIKQLIPEYKESKGAAANAVHKESKEILDAAFNAFLDPKSERHGENLVIPIIGDKYDKIMENYVSKLEKAGYKVDFVYKDASAQASMNRVVQRAIRDGRVIGMSTITQYGDLPYEVYRRIKNEGKYNIEYVDDNNPLNRK